MNLTCIPGLSCASFVLAGIPAVTAGQGRVLSVSRVRSDAAFKTIQDAVNAARPGDTVPVHNAAQSARELLVATEHSELNRLIGLSIDVRLAGVAAVSRPQFSGGHTTPARKKLRSADRSYRLRPSRLFFAV